MLLFIRTQNLSELSLIRAVTGRDDLATSTRQISTPSIASILVRVRITAACETAPMRCVVSHEAVGVRWLDERGVVAQAERPALVVDADEERAAVGVEEPGDRLHDGVLHPLVLDPVAQVPSRRGLELDLEGLVAGDQLGAGHGEEPALALEPLGDLLGERGVGSDLREHGARHLVDVELGRGCRGRDGWRARG